MSQSSDFITRAHHAPGVQMRCPFVLVVWLESIPIRASHLILVRSTSQPHVSFPPFKFQPSEHQPTRRGYLVSDERRELPVLEVCAEHNKHLLGRAWLSSDPVPALFLPPSLRCCAYCSTSECIPPKHSLVAHSHVAFLPPSPLIHHLYDPTVRCQQP